MQMFMIYILIFAVIFILELLYFWIATKFNIVDLPSRRGSSKVITLRGGGIIFWIGTFVFFLYSGFQYPWFFLGASLIALVSFWDDIHSLSPRTRLCAQIASLLCMFYEVGIWSEQSLWLLVPILIANLGVINIFNFMDGINGITGGYSLSVLLTLLYVNTHVVTFVNTDLIVICVLAVSIFCFFNFRTKAKCFAGDVGSVCIAFILLFLMCKLTILTKDLSWFVLMAMYGVDGCLTIIHRMLLHEKISTPHRKHAYQIMANELKIPHVMVSLIYISIQIVINIIYLLCHGYLTAFFVVFLLAILYILFMKKYFKLHKL